MDDERAFEMNPASINSVGSIYHTVLSGFAGVMNSGALALFFISVCVSVGFILFAIGRAMMQGGGAVFETVAFRVFIVTALTAFVVGFPAFGQVVRTDINNFAAHIAGTNQYVSGEAFTPAGILQTNDKLAAAITESGQGSPWQLLAAMNPVKQFTVALIQIGGGILAYDLLFGNVSLDIVFGTCAFLVGLIMNPWLSSFTNDFFRLIVSAAVFVIAIGVLVSIGQAMAGITLGQIAGHGKTVMSSNDIISIGIGNALYAVLAAIIPVAIASRIGGQPLLQLGSVLASVRSGKASVGL